MTRYLIILLHGLFWIGLSAIFYGVNIQFLPAETALVKVSAVMLLFALVFYFNSKFLVPVFLEKKRLIIYIILAIGVLLVSIRLRLMIDELMPQSRLPFQALLSNRRPYLSAFLMLSFWLVLSLAYQLYVSRLKREKEHLALLHELTIARNEFLKNQINPHFLFNNLNNLYSLIQVQSPLASELVLRLSDVLRYSVYKGATDQVFLREEVEQLRNLIELYQLKEDNKLSITLDDSQLTTNAAVEPLLLIPLLENCFKHGSILTDPDGFIVIELKSNESEVEITLVNSVGKMHEKQSDEGGIGLSNLKKRLHLSYGERAQFTTDEKDGLFTVRLHIQWKEIR